MLNGQMLSPFTASGCADGAFSPLFNLQREKNMPVFVARPLIAFFSHHLALLEDRICDGQREHTTEQGNTLL